MNIREKIERLIYLSSRRLDINGAVAEKEFNTLKESIIAEFERMEADANQMLGETDLKRSFMYELSRVMAENVRIKSHLKKLKRWNELNPKLKSENPFLPEIEKAITTPPAADKEG